MFSIHTDDECFYVGMNRGNDKTKNYSPEPTHFTPYQCCPTSVEKASARIAILSDTNLGNSKDFDNEITFRFTKAAPMTNSAPSKSKGSKAKAPAKFAPVVEEEKPRRAKKEERESKNKDTEVAPAPSKKLREREMKEPKETRDKDSDKKEKKGKDKKDKGKNAQDDDGLFKISNWW